MSKNAKSVLVVNIDKADSDSNGVFLPTNGALVAKLKTHPALQVEIIDTISSLQSKCIEYDPKTTVLLFVNELVTENDILIDIVQNFVKGGALAIFTCLFAPFADPEHKNKLFKSLGLPWKVSAIGVQRCIISPIGRFLLNDYEERFSAKVNMLTNVLPQQMLYTLENDVANQNVLLSEGKDMAVSSSTMAAFSKVGRGAVSYIGSHVNMEEGFIRMIVSLCTVN